MDESKRVERTYILVVLIGWQFYGIIYLFIDVNDEIKKSANIVHAFNWLWLKDFDLMCAIKTLRITLLKNNNNNKSENHPKVIKIPNDGSQP